MEIPGDVITEVMRCSGLSAYGLCRARGWELSMHLMHSSAEQHQ